MNRPVILTDIVPRWKAHSNWTFDYLLDVVGGQVVQVNVSDTPDFKSNVTAVRPMPFGEFIARLASPRTSEYLYLRFARLFSGLESDIDFPRLLPTRPQSGAELWIGQRGVATHLHVDPYYNLFAQIRGRKRVILAPPEAWRSVYPYPWYSSQAHRSRVDAGRPDLEAHPRFRRVRLLDFVLDEGELLFIPAFWWHYLESLDTTISVNQFFQLTGRDAVRIARLRLAGRSLQFAYRRLLTGRRA